MNGAEINNKAKVMVSKMTLRQLREAFEATEAMAAQLDAPDVRGWLMDEISGASPRSS